MLNIQLTEDQSKIGNGELSLKPGSSESVEELWRVEIDLTVNVKNG